ncbi:MFS general substrate transporter [Rhizoclosmatium globosum]|uniref:Lysosomal dipeptide transporter MFSD1 n=1 Tax=Rhizoclosmatium globosum TaxID=329046 RepID=A0A1Y2CAC3_9FUNG|nr:MFS general substrate transporter [Rhizoclosmatium globosum]|eukprot:ORY43982.1 MFS general substrate transporter [Rhizoclosmatium globosum]
MSADPILTTTFANTFSTWGTGYENTANEWIARKLQYNSANEITVWVLESPSNLLLAHAETQTDKGWTKNSVDPIKVASIGSVFVPEELRGTGHGKKLVQALVSELKKEGYKAVVLMAGGADSTYYSRFGFKQSPYTLMALEVVPRGASTSSTLKAHSMTLSDLERICQTDSLSLKSLVDAGTSPSTFALIPSLERLLKVRNTYLTFGNAPVPEHEQSKAFGVFLNESNFITFAHFYRNKRLCLTRFTATTNENAVALLDAAKQEAEACGFEWIYLWLGDSETNGLLGQASRESGFVVREWFDEPMYQLLDDDFAGQEPEWIGNQRYVTTTMWLLMEGRHGLLLFLSCLLLFGNYYAFDNPAALNRQLMIHMGRDYDSWQYELGLIYIIYSFPNMFLPYFGGLLVDKLGMQVFIVYSTFGFLGQVLFSVGIHYKNIWVMLVGRFLFGVGGESLVVVQGCLMAASFEGEELAFALGLNLCVSRLGSVVNAVLSPVLDKQWGVEAAVAGGTAACLISFLSSLILYAILPESAKRRVIVSANTDGLEASSPETLFPVEVQRNTWDPEDSDLITTNSDVSCRNGSLQRRHFRSSSEAISIVPNETTPLLFVPSEPPLVYGFCNAFSQFPLPFWILCLMYVVFYGTAWCFNNTASDFLQSKWYANDTITAGLVMSIPDSTSSVLVVLCGYFLDSTRSGTTLLILSFTAITLVHILLGFTNLNPVPSLIVLGLAYSINPVVIWPSVAVVIQRQERSSRVASSPDTVVNEDVEGESILGAAYGVCTSALNVALTIIPLVAAWIRVESGGGWLGVECFYGGLAGIGLAGAIGLWWMDGLKDRRVDEEVEF